MAASPAHRFGQIIGEVVEAAIVPLLEKFARENGLYLDKHGERPCRSGKKCTWIDLNQNEIEGNFNDKDSAIDFLRIYQPIALN